MSPRISISRRLSPVKPSVMLVLTFIAVLVALAACGAEPIAAPVVNTPVPTTIVETSPTETQPLTETVPPTAATPVAATSVPTSTLASEPDPTATPAPTATPPPNPTPVTPTISSMPTPSPTLTTVAAPTPTATSTSTPIPTPEQPASTWRGITVAPEDRCSPYESDDYPYSPSVEPKIVEQLGGVYGPYTGTWFETIRDTDIEHIVARSEAHDSGLCAVSAATRGQFASDLLNLTLASPSINRHQKVDKDASDWLPDLNRCWYVDRVVQVRREYGLTIDRAEADAIDRVLAGCGSTEMVVLTSGASTPVAPTTPTPGPNVDALALWDDNGNGRITCAEARAHGIAPVRRGHPAYQYMNDADDDGIVCE